MHWASRCSLGFILYGVAGLGSSCNLNPVHRAGVNNLGPERDDLYPPESEFHRPGEPCAPETNAEKSEGLPRPPLKTFSLR